MWQPFDVYITSLILPTGVLNATSSKFASMAPLPKYPNSPPLTLDGHYENSAAYYPNASSVGFPSGYASISLSLISLIIVSSSFNMCLALINLILFLIANSLSASAFAALSSSSSCAFQPPPFFLSFLASVAATAAAWGASCFFLPIQIADQILCQQQLFIIFSKVPRCTRSTTSPATVPPSPSACCSPTPSSPSKTSTTLRRPWLRPRRATPLSSSRCPCWSSRASTSPSRTPSCAVIEKRLKANSSQKHIVGDSQTIADCVLASFGHSMVFNEANPGREPLQAVVANFPTLSAYFEAQKEENKEYLATRRVSPW
ncbi:hypothetical protein FGO68_gene7608 [Halteria grandinella]|uniref:GST C-terminal domain-containing protein n=1 Tax=Halteria grandinella TaxID=5974 RepID=A0A8J8NGK6_HALGN|nr:hypothetical protein FGO68_gene7608 [Halteria grandinella]